MNTSFLKSSRNTLASLVTASKAYCPQGNPPPAPVGFSEVPYSVISVVSTSSVKIKERPYKQIKCGFNANFLIY